MPSASFGPCSRPPRRLDGLVWNKTVPRPSAALAGRRPRRLPPPVTRVGEDVRASTEPPATASDRRPPAFRSATFAFWLLAAAALLNLNHFFNNVLGTGWFVTLAAALVGTFLIVTVRIPFQRALGLPGYLIVATLISYLAVGMAAALITGVAWNVADLLLPFRIGLAALIVVAAALGASAALHRIGAERLLYGVLAFLAVYCVFVLASPYLLEDVYVFLPDRYREIASGRATGLARGPNIAGAMACNTVVAALCLLTGGRHRAFAGLAAILGSAAVVMTFSRTAMLALGVSLLFFIWSWSSYRRCGRTRAAGWLVIGGMVGFLAFVATHPERLTEREADLKRLHWVANLGDSILEGGDVRFRIWNLALPRIAESPFFGSGLSRFHTLEGAPHACTKQASCGVHNSYLLLWGEAGIIPVTLFVFFIGSLLWMRLKLPPSIAMDAAAGWMLVFAVRSMAADGTMYAFWNAFIIGLICALASHAARAPRGRVTKRTLAERPAPVGAAAHRAASPATN